MTEQLQLLLTTGDLWDDHANHPIDNSCHPAPHAWRRSRAYIEQFRERIPLGRAIRLKCATCMGGAPDRMPLGGVAQAIEECGSCACPLWPFRFGHDPWRPEPSEAQLAAARANAARFRGEPAAAGVGGARIGTDPATGGGAGQHDTGNPDRPFGDDLPF